MMNKEVLYFEYLYNYITVISDDLTVCNKLRSLYSNLIVEKPDGDNIGVICIESFGDQLIIFNDSEKVRTIKDGWVQKFNKMLQNTILFALKKTYMFFHSSGVAFGDTAIIFVGTPGSGKTSCSIYLALTKKWDFVGDDFLPIAVADNKLCSFPGCIHAKKNMISLLGLKVDEADHRVNCVGIKNKIFYFQPELININQTNSKFSNLIFVFPHYNLYDNSFKKVDGVEKISHFLRCVYNIDYIMQDFLSFIANQHKCYSLSYSNFEYLDEIIESIVKQ